MKFESKIATFLDAHLLFALDAGTKQLIGCKWVMGTVDCDALPNKYTPAQDPYGSMVIRGTDGVRYCGCRRAGGSSST